MILRSLPPALINQLRQVLGADQPGAFLAAGFVDWHRQALGRRRAMGFAIAAGMIHALQNVSMAMMGMDEEEEEEEEEEEAFRDLAAPWQRNANILALGRNEKGQTRLIDLSFLDLYNYWKRPIKAMLRDQSADDAIRDVAREVFEPFFGRDIAFGAIVEAITNTKESGGRVFNPAAPVWEQSVDIADHIRRDIQPGIMTNLERIVKASSGQISASGRPYRMKDEMAALAGFRVTTFDPKASIYYKAFEFQDQKRDATRILSSRIRDPNKVTQDRLRKAFGSARETRIEADEEMIRLVVAAMKSGLTRHQVYVSLVNSGVSKRTRWPW